MKVPIPSFVAIAPVVNGSHIHALLLRRVIEVLLIGIEDDGLETETLLRRRKLLDVMNPQRLTEFVVNVIQGIVKHARRTISEDARTRCASTFDAEILVPLAAEYAAIYNCPALVTTMAHETPVVTGILPA